jgi:hypothetical protein
MKIKKIGAKRDKKEKRDIKNGAEFKIPKIRDEKLIDNSDKQ